MTFNHYYSEEKPRLLRCRLCGENFWSWPGSVYISRRPEICLHEADDPDEIMMEIDDVEAEMEVDDGDIPVDGEETEPEDLVDMACRYKW